MSPRTLKLYTPAETARYERLIAQLAKLAWRRAPSTQPIAVRLTVFIVPTGGWPDWKLALIPIGMLSPTAKPDGDNVEKAVWDACSKIVWADDAQVTEWNGRKRWRDTPGVLVEITELDTYPSSIDKKPSKTGLF